MKYSLTPFHPDSKASEQALKRSSSVTFLLITSRMRWVPASGAKVRPALRTDCIFSNSSLSRESMRKLGRATDTRFFSMRSMTSGNRSWRWE